MTAAPRLVTARLELSLPAAGDRADLCALTADAETRRFLGSFVPGEADAFARLHRNAGSWALHGYGTFMVRLRGAARIIGNCGMFRSFRGFGAEYALDDAIEAGWIVHRDHWGAGIAREAMEAALAWFDTAHPGQRIACMIEQDNAASEALAARLGFREYARHQQPGEKPLILYARG